MCDESIIKAGDATHSSDERMTYCTLDRVHGNTYYDMVFSRDWNQRQVADKISFYLDEPKRGLIFRVVNALGKKKAWNLLVETKSDYEWAHVTSSGVSSSAMDRQRADSSQKDKSKRTLGGVFLSKVKDSVSKEVYKKIYEIEVKRKKEWRQKNRLRKRQQMEEKISGLKFQIKCAIEPSLSIESYSAVPNDCSME